MAVFDVPLRELPPQRLAAVLTPAGVQRLEAALAVGRDTFAGSTLWNVNSTHRGGGVAEMLATLLPYARGGGVDARWLVVRTEGGFFRITKRLHNRLHGHAGDGGPLGQVERMAYEASLAPAAQRIAARLRPGDIVLLHDPQTAGLIPALKAKGVPVIWRAHIGIDHPGDLARSAWAFLAPYVQAADACVFSRPEYAWDIIDPARTVIIRPSIDPFSPKNADLDDASVHAILVAAGVWHDSVPTAAPTFTRLDGTTGEVHRRVRAEHERPLVPSDSYILQVSRWDALKDPVGVIDGFARHVAQHTDAHLVYAGPSVQAVADDPEGAEVLDRARSARRALPLAVRQRIHLVRVPMADLDENAVIVNALQRAATIVVQKSLAEGFGLTVAEAMWKGRPVVASAIGGIRDQIDHGVSGVLLDDPRDGPAFGLALRRLLDDPEEAAVLGRAGRERIRETFLSDRSLVDYLTLLGPLLAERRVAAAGSARRRPR